MKAKGLGDIAVRSFLLGSGLRVRDSLLTNRLVIWFWGMPECLTKTSRQNEEFMQKGGFRIVRMKRRRCKLEDSIEMEFRNRGLNVSIELN